MIESFVSRASPKLVFGPGTLRDLPSCVREAGGSSVFLVSDSGIERAGHLVTVRRLLEGDGISAVIFAGSKENPTESDVAACRDAAVGHRFDCIVGMGGGSSLDTAKGCNFLLTNGGAMRDYHGTDRARKPLLPFIAIPTTAGTGSECQSYALISRDDTHEKMACGDVKARARTAILDPELTATQPKSVAILTGLDALAHALESAVCTRRNPVSSLYSDGGFCHLATAIGAVVAGEPSRDDRGAMLLGAALSGLAIENSMLGAAHAMANPLTARHHIVHGHAVAFMLPHVMRFNAEEPGAQAIYTRYSTFLRETGITQLPLIDWVADLVTRSSLDRVDNVMTDVLELAHAASRQWTGQFNPRPLHVEDYVALYHRALSAHFV